MSANVMYDFGWTSGICILARHCGEPVLRICSKFEVFVGFLKAPWKTSRKVVEESTTAEEESTGTANLVTFTEEIL